MKYFALAIGCMVVGCGESQDVRSSLSELREAVARVEMRIDDLPRTEATSPSKTPPEKSPRTLAIEAAQLVQQQVDAGEFVRAYDFLLAAMRLDPTSPEVFETALRFTRAAAESKDEAIGLAHDVYVRTAALIPFQDLTSIAAARDKYSEAGKHFGEAEPYEPPDPIEVLQSRIGRVREKGLPPDIASIATQAIREELDALAVAAGDDVNDPDGLWEEWGRLQDELEALELEVLEQLYADVSKRIEQWNLDVEDDLKRYETAELSDFSVIGANIVAKVHSGYRLRSESGPFVEAGVTKSNEQQDLLDERIEYLERTREWMHNQHALATIQFVDDDVELSDLDKLRRLARYDERRFSPYVLQRFQDQWDKHFEELDADDKVEATRIRVLGDAQR